MAQIIPRKLETNYKDTEIFTANQGKLIIMLYDGAIRFLNTAKNNMNIRTYDIVNENIIKAQDIITELMISLNMDEGGEIATNLFGIYAYLKKRLLEANIEKDSKILEEVISHLVTLKESWEEASKSAPAQSVANGSSGSGLGISIQG